MSPRASVIVLACVVGVALVLGVVRLFRGDVVPTANVPAVGWEETQEVSHPEESDDEGPLEEQPPVVDVPPETTPPTRQPAIPLSFNIALPFTSQAPTGNWDAVHEETCEEASVYMVTQYFAGVPAGVMSAAASDAAMLGLVAYEDAHGYGVSVSAAELKAIIDDYYDGAYTIDIVDNPTVDDLRALIADGFPVIVPAAGRLLGNPFFTGEGPLYHMLVVRGYEDGRFITNDPGTRHGENYTYTEAVFMNAIHDWNNGDPVNGTARVLVMRLTK